VLDYIHTSYCKWINLV